MRSSDIQKLTLSNHKWKVDLLYESWGLEKKTIQQHKSDAVLEWSASGAYTATLKIDVSDKNSQRTIVVTGIKGGVYLFCADENINYQSVKIENDNLILSLGVDFISIDLNKLDLNWRLEPDMAEVFEFHDFENEYLLRGEVGIHRIDSSGHVKWTFTGKDIWVNMEGRPEVEITENSIKLLDFNSDEYEIDFNGKHLIESDTASLFNKRVYTKKRNSITTNKIWSWLRRK